MLPLRTFGAIFATGRAEVAVVAEFGMLLSHSLVDVSNVMFPSRHQIELQIHQDPIQLLQRKVSVSSRHGTTDYQHSEHNVDLPAVEAPNMGKFKQNPSQRRNPLSDNSNDFFDLANSQNQCRCLGNRSEPANPSHALAPYAAIRHWLKGSGATAAQSHVDT